MANDKGWYALLDTLALADEEFAFYAERPPMACPNDGEPLTQAPVAESASGVEWFCKFDGWRYPQDWIRPQRL